MYRQYLRYLISKMFHRQTTIPLHLLFPILF
nr:MAG TPA: hypothetical protein [Crassvirales sp.]